MNSNWYKLVMKMTKVRYGKNLLLKGAPVIFNKKGAELTIGDNVTIKSSFLSNLVGLYSKTIIVTRAPGAYIRIGNNVGMSGVTIYARKGIEIGENTAIGGNTKILDNDFHPIEAETRNKLLADKNGGDSDLVPAKPIKIGKNCFIGCNAIILKGTELGDGCVVGAGAVVSGKFEADSVIVGNPARVIKKVGES
ncbi:acetyltransferase-like isoleucine patch superfamily enzyme [Ruminococcaceae bacterium R-25]|nr:acetyltransferase-like isoleucine patch superfamily enzyme [Ruminococcaceae bacterium R-25]SUQ11408.1 Acetyltransferase (isoleucine patch superfamily) [Oscillospiraceae bacterium]